jgi:hypothetical protein
MQRRTGWRSSPNCATDLGADFIARFGRMYYGSLHLKIRSVVDAAGAGIFSYLRVRAQRARSVELAAGSV